MFEIFIASQNTVKFLSGWGFECIFLQTLNKVFFIYFSNSKMPTYNQNHKQYYSTRVETLRIFRDEEKKSCTCRTEVWAGNENKVTCLNCIRKRNLKEELQKKGFGQG